MSSHEIANGSFASHRTGITPDTKSGYSVPIGATPSRSSTAVQNLAWRFRIRVNPPDGFDVFWLFDISTF